MFMQRSGFILNFDNPRCFLQIFRTPYFLWFWLFTYILQVLIIIKWDSIERNMSTPVSLFKYNIQPTCLLDRGFLPNHLFTNHATVHLTHWQLLSFLRSLWQAAIFSFSTKTRISWHISMIFFPSFFSVTK